MKFYVHINKLTWHIQNTTATECYGPWKPSLQEALQLLALHLMEQIAQNAYTYGHM